MGSLISGYQVSKPALKLLFTVHLILLVYEDKDKAFSQSLYFCPVLIYNSDLIYLSYFHPLSNLFIMCAMTEALVTSYYHAGHFISILSCNISNRI